MLVEEDFERDSDGVDDVDSEGDELGLSLAVTD